MDLTATPIYIADNVSDARSTEEYLRDAGFTKVFVQSDGLKALTEIKDKKPGVVIANISLPKYTGIQIFKSMSGDGGMKSIKFILTTPKMNRREKDTLAKENIDNILEKPLNAELLKETIFSLFGFSKEAMLEVAGQSYDEAMAKFDKEDYESALGLFKEAGEALPSARSFFMQGRCYFELGLYDQAIAAFQNVLEQDGKYPETHYFLGLAQQAKQDYSESIRSLKNATREDADNSHTHLALGKSFIGADKIDEAEKSFNAATQLAPDDVKNRAEIGNAWLDGGKYDLAEKAFGDAIVIMPENIVLYNRMAIALRRQSKYKEAIDIYLRALRIEPTNEILFFNLARALHESGKNGKAVKALEKAIDLKPDFTKALGLKTEYEK